MTMTIKSNQCQFITNDDKKRFKSSYRFDGQESSHILSGAVSPIFCVMAFRIRFDSSSLNVPMTRLFPPNNTNNNSNNKMAPAARLSLRFIRHSNIKRLLRNHIQLIVQVDQLWCVESNQRTLCSTCKSLKDNETSINKSPPPPLYTNNSPPTRSI